MVLKALMAKSPLARGSISMRNQVPRHEILKVIVSADWQLHRNCKMNVKVA